MSEAPLAELRDVHKAFGARRVLDGANLIVQSGEVVALLGPNGAGKTTAIRVLLGLRRPDAGTARLSGRDPTESAARRDVGSTPQETDLPETLRVSELVDLVRIHYPRPARRAELLRRFGIADLATREAGGLSGGQRRRVAVALAFAGNPRLVVLDEPSSGLDRAARSGLWATVRSFAAAGRGILLATHDLAEVEALASRLVVLREGRTVLEGTVADIRRGTGRSVVRIRQQSLPRLTYADGIEQSGGEVLLFTRTTGALMRELVAVGADLDEIQIAPLSLEHVLTQKEQA